MVRTMLLALLAKEIVGKIVPMLHDGESANIIVNMPTNESEGSLSLKMGAGEFPLTVNAKIIKINNGVMIAGTMVNDYQSETKVEPEPPIGSDEWLDKFNEQKAKAMIDELDARNNS